MRLLEKTDSSKCITFMTAKPVWIQLLLVISFAAHGVAAVGIWTGNVDAQYSNAIPLEIPLTAEKTELITVQVSGQIKLGDAPWSGPEGSGYYGFDSGGDMPPMGYSHGIVMLMIGDNWFSIEGGARTLESPHNGLLSLYVNDNEPLDNQGSFLVTVTIGPKIVGDADEDGLSDLLEDMLLEQYAPELKFDDSEGVLPANVYRYLRNTDLLVDGDEDSEMILDRKQVPYYPEWFLDQQSQSGLSTNYLDEPRLVLTYCNIRNSHRDGKINDSWVTPSNTGVYGHVVPVGDQIAIQYWIFYGYNDSYAFLDQGSHEGDWELFEMYFDQGIVENPTNWGLMRKAVWHGHGFNPGTAVWTSGLPPNWYVHDNRPELGWRPPMPMQHPPVYIEARTHGSWHTAVEPLSYQGDNDGDLVSFIPTNITNIGEVYRPRLGTEVVTQYNGRWGAFKRSPPIGPDVHCPPGPAVDRWQWPAPEVPATAVYVGGWGSGISTLNGRGRISWPWHHVYEAAAMANPGDDILIYPGTYSETVTIDKKVTLKAPHGNVMIGQ